MNWVLSVPKRRKRSDGDVFQQLGELLKHSKREMVAGNERSLGERLGKDVLFKVGKTRRL